MALRDVNTENRTLTNDHCQCGSPEELSTYMCVYQYLIVVKMRVLIYSSIACEQNVFSPAE